MLHTIHKLKTYFLSFLELQLLISIMMLPVLVAWGLPISTMSMIGNLIFTHILTFFIFISALLFTTDLIGIPNSFIAQALEYTTSVWYYCLSFGSHQWMIGFPLWMLPTSCFFAGASYAIYTKKYIGQINRIIWLIIFFLTIHGIRRLFLPSCHMITIKQGSQSMYLVQAQDRMYAFDCGALGARPSSQNWIEYNLMPTLIQTMARTTIDLLILCKSNSRTEDAVNEFVTCIPTKKIIRVNKQTQFDCNHGVSAWLDRT